MAIQENLSINPFDLASFTYVIKISTKSVPPADLRLECLIEACFFCFADFPRLRNT